MFPDFFFENDSQVSFSILDNGFLPVRMKSQSWFLFHGRIISPGRTVEYKPADHR